MPKLTEWPYPRLVAHRGGGSVAPENTLSAMRCGFAHGFKMVEFDVKLTRDHHSVLLHDSTLERTTNGTGVAGDLSLGELVRLDAGSWFSPAFAGESIPTLAAIARYTLSNGMASNIEIKPTPGMEVPTGELVARQARHDWSGSTVKPLLSSFSAVALQAAMTEAPELPRGLIANTLPENWRQLLAELDCVSVHLKHTAVTRDMVSSLHEAGYRIAVWTVNDPVRAQELLNWGIDAVITDALDRISPV